MYDFGNTPLADLLAQSSPELVDAFARSGLFDEQSALNAAALKQAQQDANTPMAQGYNVGKTYVAASPVEHLANAMRMARGEVGMRDAMQGQQANLADLLAGKRAGLQIAAGRRKPPPDVVGYAAPIGTGEAGTDGWGY
jgi:hypothetical protein